MTNQLMFQLAQRAAELYRDGFRIDGCHQFFEGGATIRVRKGETLCSEAPEVASYLVAIQMHEENKQMDRDAT